MSGHQWWCGRLCRVCGCSDPILMPICSSICWPDLQTLTVSNAKAKASSSPHARVGLLSHWHVVVVDAPDGRGPASGSLRSRNARTLQLRQRLITAQSSRPERRMEGKLYCQACHPVLQSVTSIDVPWRNDRHGHACHGSHLKQIVFVVKKWTDVESARHQQFNGLLMIHALEVGRDVKFARTCYEWRGLVVLKSDVVACVAAWETIQAFNCKIYRNLNSTCPALTLCLNTH